MLAKDPKKEFPDGLRMLAQHAEEDGVDYLLQI